MLYDWLSHSHTTSMVESQLLEIICHYGKNKSKFSTWTGWRENTQVHNLPTLSSILKIVDKAKNLCKEINPENETWKGTSTAI